MKGNIEYERQYQRKIDRMLSNDPRLRGFYSFIAEETISTIYTYLLHVNRFLSHTEKESLKDLELDDFTGYMLKIQKNKNGESTTSSYRIVAYSALRNYGNYLVAAKILADNPVNYIKRPKAIDSKKTIEKRERGYLEKKEINKYMSNIDSGIGNDRSISRQKEWKERDLAIITLFLVTGIRCSALLKIDVSDIDFDKKKILVTDKGNEVNPYDLSDDTIFILQQWIEKRKILLEDKKEDALFISSRRTRMHQNSISNIVNKYAGNIKGKNITPHKLRATYGTQLYNATGDIYFVQQCMNHSSPKTTETYVRGCKNRTKNASDIMNSIINRKKN